MQRVTLQARSCSADRTRSPVPVSQKREFFKLPPETIGGKLAKACRWRPFLRLSGPGSPIAGLAGWGERIRTSMWRVRNQTLSPVRAESQNHSLLNFISSSKRLNFENRTESSESRASERNGPFGEIMSRLCRLGVRSPNEKSVLLLGLIADKSARRIHGFGQAGGAKGIRTGDTVV
jgi:hypothetical protein